MECGTRANIRSIITPFRLRERDRRINQAAKSEGPAGAKHPWYVKSAKAIGVMIPQSILLRAAVDRIGRGGSRTAAIERVQDYARMISTGRLRPIAFDVHHAA
jgi:hypothetical protein